MATIPYCHFSTAEGLAKEIYDDIVRTYGIEEPHGIYQLMGNTPEFLAASWRRSRYLYGTDPNDTNVSLSKLSLKDKHYVTLGVSATNNCEYCVRLHTTRLEQLGMTKEDLIELMMVVDVTNGYDKFAEGTRLGDDPTIPFLGAEDADGSTKDVYKDIEAASGNKEPDAIYRLMGYKPEYLKASWERSKLCFQEEGRLGLRTKHMVAMGIAATNSNDYYVTTHTGRLRELAMSDEEIVELLLTIDLACGYNRYVQGLQVKCGETPFVPSSERGT